MELDAVKALLEQNLEDCDVSVSGDGRHIDVMVVGDVFSGLSPVKKQQLVYKVLNAHIASGEIHAVNMKLFTREQWAKRE